MRYLRLILHLCAIRLPLINSNRPAPRPGSTKQRVLRSTFACLSMLPSWVLVFYQRQILENKFILLSGLNDYMLNSIHFLVLYAWLFAVLPVHVFPLLKLTGIKNENKATFLSMSDYASDSSPQSAEVQKPFLK